MANLTYKDAGVDISAGNKAVKLIKGMCEETFGSSVINELGSFAGMFALPGGMKEPVLVSGTDGVGTKLKIAFMTGKHSTVGQDLVAMCVNDILTHGARPLFFLDYIALGKLEPAKVAQVVRGIADGCKLADCALLGGETAEMPGFYKEDEYDLAGFAVGVVEREKIINGSKIKAGDAVIGLPSTGLHSNGYSLARKVFFEVARLSIENYLPELGATVGEELLKPTKIYAGIITRILEKFPVAGLAHITGGGLIENIPRVLPQGLKVTIKSDSWPVLPVFKFIKSAGGVSEREMYRTFNMGIGMAVIVDFRIAEEVMAFLRDMGEKAYRIGSVEEGKNIVEIL